MTIWDVVTADNLVSLWTYFFAVLIAELVTVGFVWLILQLVLIAHKLRIANDKDSSNAK